MEKETKAKLIVYFESELSEKEIHNLIEEKLGEDTSGFQIFDVECE
jgi:hypothetical protein